MRVALKRFFGSFVFFFFVAVVVVVVVVVVVLVLVVKDEKSTKKKMKIYVKSMQGILGGKQFHVVVLNDKTTIKALKKKIVTASQKHDLPTLLDAEILEIEFNDEILDDKRNLAHYEITDNTIIYVSMHSCGGGLTVIVACSEANITVGGLLESDTIMKLKETIDEICPGLEPPAVDRKLSYRSKVCTNDKTLEDCKISEGCQITMRK